MRIRIKETDIWKAPLAYPKYEVSSLGRLRDASSGNLLYPETHSGRYLRFKGVAVHKLVLLAFHGPKPFPKAQCRHLDGNRMNNRETNLCWGTARENYNDKVAHGTAFESENVRIKLSNSARGKVITGETKYRMRVAHLGVPLSTEHRAIQKEKALERWKRYREQKSLADINNAGATTYPMKLVTAP